MSTEKPPTAPASLGKPGRTLWRRVTSDYELSAAEQAVLEAAALAYDRLTLAQAELTRDGLTVPGRFGPRAHPMTAVVRDSTTLLARCLRQLDVALSDEELQRPTPLRPPARATRGKSTRRRTA